MNNEQAIKNKIVDGRFMLGICTQWFCDNNYNYLELYVAICRKSFGFRKRYAYIESSEFKINLHTLKKHRDYLVSIGVLEWKKTKGFTMYKILEPIDEIKRFSLFEKIKETKIDKKESIEDIVNSGW